MSNFDVVTDLLVTEKRPGIAVTTNSGEVKPRPLDGDTER